ncbi:MAG: DNA primase, partial [Chitinophagaceae bacterium]|nr:DNA primase [Chitinophagaceae bacterium]
IEDAELFHLANLFREAYNNGQEPTMKGFLFHEDQTISKQVVALADFGEELSPNWIRIYEKPFPTKEELYQQEIHSVLTYLKLRKIKKLMDENQRDMENPHSSEELVTLIKTHQHLKEIEMELTKAMGTVIFR